MRGESNSYNVIRCNGDHVSIERMSWDAQMREFFSVQKEAFRYNDKSWIAVADTPESRAG